MLNAKIKYNMTSRETECNIIVYKLAKKRVAEKGAENQCYIRYSGCAK